MKQTLFLLAVGFSSLANAQQLKFDKGQKITITSNTSQEIDMMGMQMVNKSNSTSSVEIKDADSKNYNAVYKLDKLTMSMDGMGQQQSYDSEKAADKESEMGKTLGSNVGKEMKITIDKSTGKATSLTPESPEKKEEGAENPLAGMMDMFGAKESETAITESVYFLIPTGKKTGDSWTDSTNAGNMKGFKTYNIKSINGNETIITLFSKLEGTQDIDAQGMQMSINISAKTEGELLLDTKTSLLRKSSRVADITGNMDMMGQSMPLTSKMTEVTEYK